MTGDYKTLSEVAREQGDPVHFVAGLLATKTNEREKESTDSGVSAWS